MKKNDWRGGESDVQNIDQALEMIDEEIGFLGTTIPPSTEDVLVEAVSFLEKLRDVLERRRG